MIKKEKSQYLLFIFLLVAITPYFYLSFFSQPIAEDFGFASYYINNDFFDLLKKSYTGMNGRYIANIIMYLNPLSFGCFILYKVIPIFQITLLIAAISYLISTLYKTTSIKILNLALIITLLYLNNMPIISEGVYWYTGSSIYQLGITCAIFYFGMLVRAIKASKTSVIKNSTLTLFLFILIGFNEVLTCITLLTLFCIALLLHKQQHLKRKLILIQLIFGVLFGLIMFLAPGNFNRDSMYVNNHQLINSLTMSLLQIGRFTLLWVLSVPFIITSFLFVSKLEQINLNLKENHLNIRLNRWFTLSLLILIIFICVFPPYWATGILGQH